VPGKTTFAGALDTMLERVLELSTSGALASERRSRVAMTLVIAPHISDWAVAGEGPRMHANNTKA
jgi:hypothetical protein